MRTKVLSWVGATGVALAAFTPLVASAQSDPDERAIRPALMLLVDSSGSMEFNSQGADPVCTGTAAVTTSTRNRWSMVIEALVGEYAGYYCTTLSRDLPAFVGQPDYNYFIPYHQPAGTNLGNGILSLYGDRVKFGLMTFDTLPATDTRFIDLWRTQPECQGADGDALSDYSYGECRRLRFEGCEHAGYWINIGARRELADTFPAVPDGVIGPSDSISELASPFDGAMVSVGPPSDDPAALDAVRSRIGGSLASRRPFGPTPLAAQIDDAYEYFNHHPDVRQPGGPGAPGDGYYECRNRFVIILSDGRPNLDFREDPLNCDQGGDCPYPLPAARVADLYASFGVRTAVIGFAANGDPEFPRMRQELEDVALAGQTADCIARAGLDVRAPDGTPSPVFWAQNRDQLMSAMSAIIDACVNTVPTTRTHAAFAPISSANGGQYQIQSSFQVVGGGPWRGYLERRRYTCNVPAAGAPTVVDQPLNPALGDDFRARLNSQATRRIYTALTNGSSGCTLSGAGCRQLLQRTGYRRADSGTLAPTVALDAGTVTPEMLGYDSGPGAARTVGRTKVLDYVFARGTAPLARRTNRLGDIYRSSPTVVTAPTLDIADESFNLFRTTPLAYDGALGRWVGAGGRPGALYVGTNDGMLHAFRLEDDPATGPNDAGEEMWAFVPPYHVSRLRDQLTTHAWYVDGTPAVKDVRFGRTLVDSGDIRPWRTILTVGQRAGGSAYMTLDVTNPTDPQFLWQFSPDNRVIDARWLRRMGLTGSVAGLATLNVRTTGVVQDIMGRRTVPPTGERGVAIIAGGTPEQCDPGEISCTAAQFRTNAVPNCTCVQFQDSNGCGVRVNHDPLFIGGTAAAVPPASIGTPTIVQRPATRCYGAPQGQYLWVVDIETGFVLKEFGPCSVPRQQAGRPASYAAGQCIDAPITGSIAPFPGIVGTVATRAYAGDAEGRMWRFDLSDPNPANWRAGVLYDLYYDQTDAMVAQRIVEAPVVSVDPEGNPTVVFGSGDPDLLEGRDLHRMASVTEYATYNPVSGAITGTRVRENWRITLNAGERLTGPLELFNNAVYFGTFNPSTSADLCEFGEGRVFGVHYRLATAISAGHALPEQLLPRPPGFALCDVGETPTAEGRVRCVRAGDNSVVFGVGITQRPTCLRYTDDAIPGVPGTRRHVQEVGGGNFQLVIQSGRGGAAAPGGWVTNVTTLDLEVPEAFSRVDSWYSLIE